MILRKLFIFGETIKIYFLPTEEMLILFLYFAFIAFLLLKFRQYNNLWLLTLLYFFYIFIYHIPENGKTIAILKDADFEVTIYYPTTIKFGIEDEILIIAKKTNQNKAHSCTVLLCTDKELLLQNQDANAQTDLFMLFHKLQFNFTETKIVSEKIKFLSQINDWKQSRLSFALYNPDQKTFPITSEKEFKSAINTPGFQNSKHCQSHLIKKLVPIDTIFKVVPWFTALIAFIAGLILEWLKNRKLFSSVKK